MQGILSTTYNISVSLACFGSGFLCHYLKNIDYAPCSQWISKDALMLLRNEMDFNNALI